MGWTHPCHRRHNNNYNNHISDNNGVDDHVSDNNGVDNNICNNFNDHPNDNKRK